MKQEIIDLQNTLATLAYYLYRQAGCPLGDNISGLTAWKDVQFEKWIELNSDLLNEDD